MKRECKYNRNGFIWGFILDINNKASKMGHQEACGFICGIYGNQHHDLQQEAVEIVYFLQ